MSDGTRKVMSISEITGMDENIISMQEIFSFVRKGIGPTARSSALSGRAGFGRNSWIGYVSPASCSRLRYSRQRWK